MGISGFAKGFILFFRQQLKKNAPNQAGMIPDALSDYMVFNNIFNNISSTGRRPVGQLSWLNVYVVCVSVHPSVRFSFNSLL